MDGLIAAGGRRGTGTRPPEIEDRARARMPRQVPKSQKSGFYKFPGGIDMFHQIVMDNCSVNVNANLLIGAHYDYKVVCSDCLAHILKLS